MKRCVAQGVVGGLLAGAVIFALLALGPLGQMAVRIDMTTTAPGYSQMFFADAGDVFSEYGSAGQSAVVGQNNLVFALGYLRGRGTDQIRWDPINIPAEVTVRSIGAGSAFVEEPVPLTSLRPSLDVTDVQANADGSISFSTLSNDGQMLLDAPLSGALRDNLRTMGLLSLAAAVLAGVVISGVLMLSRQQAAAGSDRSVTIGRSLRRVLLALVLLSGGILLAWSFAIR